MAPDYNYLITKTVLHPGSKQATFKDGTKCFFHFKTCKNDPEKTVLDDSRKMGKRNPLELIIGKKFKLEVWEVILQKMAIREVAEFLVDKSLVLQYPFISKTLRDIDRPPEQRKSHFCSMTIQTEGVGYDDLNELIKKPQDLIFTIDLVDVQQPDSYNKEIWQMSEDERIKLVPELKEKGNDAYKKKNFGIAAEMYSQAIGILEQFMLKEKPYDTEWNELNLQKNIILLNFAQCKLIQEDFYAVIEHCTTVLKTDPNNVKALFRRGKAHIGAWNPKDAQDDLNKVLELDQSLSNAVKKELQCLEDMIKVKNIQDMNKLKNLFI
ncbi:AH receptor-interacting protein [Onthophagus taurus]|uniref:AH receptor-interacting protein n=1 Tax=Onthophagus taurus TaxID=166361 RepID=UPI000C207355|nr:AH receptor-interacting protein [Onthophagus taurus]